MNKFIALPNTSGRNSNLDFLRGISILLVIGAHIRLRNNNSIIGHFSFFLNNIGWIGVDIFFVISGFLISGLLFNELNKYGKINVVHFLIRRGFKIYPSYYIFLLYSIGIVLIKDVFKHSLNFVFLNKYVIPTLPNIIFIQNYFSAPRIWGHTWSLAVEEHFYFVIPFILSFFHKTNRIKYLFYYAFSAIILCLLFRLIFLYLLNSPFWQLQFETHFRFEGLFFGVMLQSLYFHNNKIVQFFKKYHRSFIPLSMIIFIPAILLVNNVFVYTFNVFAASLLLLGIYNSNSNILAFKTADFLYKVTCVIGFYSFSIYIWHITFIGYGAKSFDLFFKLIHIPQKFTLVSYCFQYVTAIVSGILLSKIIELPFLKIRDKLFPSRSKESRIILK